jgi:DNA-binding Lrp family transcriptional regulator
MTTKAYVLIETAVGKSAEVTQALKDLSSTEIVDAVTGPYDIIAIVAADDLISVGETVTKEIHMIPGIARTITCLSVGSQ